MGLSRSARILTLLVIDTAFFFVELIVGYAVGSLALVADSFHMLNDVLSLLVALYTIKLATSPSTAKNSYGWQRAEILGALINGVFLVALCVSIALEAIGRFFSPPEISNPKLIVIVGSMGLLSNIVGLFLFHEHGHSHGGHTHGEVALPTSSEESAAAVIADGPQGRPRHRADSMSSLYAHPAQTRAQVIETAHEFGYGRPSSPVDEFPSVMSPPNKHGRMPSTSRKSHRHSASRPRNNRTASGNVNVPAVGSNETLPPAASRSTAEGSSTASTTTVVDDTASSVEHLHKGHAHDHKHKHNHTGEHHNHTHMAKDAGAAEEGHAHDHSHEGHGHGGEKGGHGHSHGSMNMRGVFLHVMGDALGNVGVITAGLVIWFCEGRWTLYFDPAVSLFITVIIFSSAIPLVKSASYILMQGVPSHVSLEAVRTDIKGVDGVVSVHELHVWQLSESTVVASVHVLISPGTDYMIAANGIRQSLHGHGVHSVTIQPEFYSGDSSPSDDDDEGTACLIRCPPEECGTDTCCPPGVPTGRLVDVEEHSENHDGNDH